MPKTKRFIDRNNSVTFHLVHRSQQDPLIADEKAPQHVLVPTASKTANVSDNKKRKEEQKKFGIFFDDDYDYLQHLRGVNKVIVDWEPVEMHSESTTRIKLPSSVFASEVEEDVGLLNKAAPHSGPRLDMDPDIVAAMDEDFDYENPENELDDNFVELANAVCDNDDMDLNENSYSSDNYEDTDDESDDDVASLTGPQYTFANEETKSHFTNYSMSSSIMRRNDQLTILDDCFENMFTKSYGDTDIGALDCEEIEGYIEPNSEMILQCAAELEEMTMNRPLSELVQKEKYNGENYEYDEEEDDLVDLDLSHDQKDRWDCESILSTYSNIYNRPKLIAEPAIQKKIRVSAKTGIPVDVLEESQKLTANALAKLDNESKQPHFDVDGTSTIMSTLSVLSIRSKNETPDERSERKKALRNYRKERRMEKKANSLAFKEEKKRQEKILINNKLNIQGIHFC